MVILRCKPVHTEGPLAAYPLCDWIRGCAPNTPKTLAVGMRERTIKIRVDDNELAAIRDRCDRPQLADWLRDLALGQKKRRPVPIADPALLRQLSAIGNNLNQVARWCNKNSPSDSVSISAALIAISRELNELKDASKNK